MFSVIGQLVVKPQFMENIEEDYHTAKFEEEDIKRKLEGMCLGCFYRIFAEGAGGIISKLLFLLMQSGSKS